MGKFLQLLCFTFFLSCIASFHAAGDRIKKSESKNSLLATTVTLTADLVSGLPESEVLVPVRVKGFKDIIAGQGTVAFDSEVITFIGVEKFGFSDLGASNFGTAQTGAGKLIFSWDDATLAGKSLADDAILFAIRFKVVGSYGTSSSISFVESPAGIEFVDKSFTIASVMLNSGKVQVPAFSITTNSVNGNGLCVGTSVSVAFAKQGTYNSNNTFRAQLSDASGSFANATIIGTGTISPITATLPVTLTPGTNYKIRVISTAPVITGTDNGSNITISSLPVVPTVSAGTRCGPGTVTLSASGAPVGGSYRWYTTATGGTAIIEATGSTYQTPSLSTTTTYYVATQNSVGCESSRVAMAATVVPPVSNNMITSDQTICSNSTAAQLTGSLPIGGGGGYIYKWEKSSDGMTFTSIAGATGQNYLPAVLNADTWFRRKITTSSSCQENVSNTIKITVSLVPAKPIVNAGNICAGEKAVLTVNSPLAAYTYRWFSTATGGNMLASGATYTTPNLTTNTTYYVEVLSAGGCASTRTAVTVTVNAASASPVVTASPTQVGGTLSLRASPIPGATYTWTGPGGFTSTVQNPTIANVTTAHSGTYSVTATVGGCSSAPAIVSVTIIDVAPITFDADSVRGTTNTEVVIPVRVQGFSKVGSMRFSINWNPDIATFVGAETFNLAGLTAANIGTTQAATGKITVSWSNPAQSYSLADSTVLFNLRFKLIGTLGQYTPITITGTPLPIAVTTENNFVVPVKTLAGAIAIRKLIKISGRVKSEKGEGVPKVMLTATGGNAPASLITKPDGQYEFEVLQNGQYTISPQKSNDSLAYNGITTLDIALIRRHILQVSALASPYKLLAADVDKNHAVTTADIAAVRRVILTQDRYFPGKQLWTFVPFDFTFANPANPFPFQDTVKVHAAGATDLAGHDFIGVKLGDLNDTWDAQTARLRTFGDVRVQLNDQQVVPGTEIMVPVRVYEFNQVSAYQFTLTWDPTVLEFASVENAALQGAFGTHKITEGKLTTAWDDPAGQSKNLLAGSTLFYVKFKVIGSLNTQTEVAVNAALTPSLAYNQQLEPLRIVPGNAKISLRSTAKPLPVGYALYQNIPNPLTKGATAIRFSIPQDEEVALSIYNPLGQAIRIFRSSYAAGEHTIWWNGQNSAGQEVSQGTYYYQLKAGHFTDTKRALILK